MLGERENSVAASLIFPSVSCSRGAASVYDLIEDENCLHEEAGVGEKFGEPSARFPGFPRDCLLHLCPALDFLARQTLELQFGDPLWQVKVKYPLFGKALSDLFGILPEIGGRVNNNPV